MDYKSTGIVFTEKPSIGIEPTRLFDRSRFGNHGTYTNVTDAQLPSGLWVRSFAGNGKIDCGDGISLDLTLAMTLMAWVTFDNIANNEAIIARDDNGGVKRNYLLYKDGANKTVFTFQVSNATKTTTHHTAVSAAIWYHCVATYDKVTMETYLNAVVGTSPTAETGTVDNDDTPLLIGARADGLELTGDVALPKIFNYALSAGQIKKIFEAERHWFGV